MNKLCGYLPLWIQVRDQTIPSREGISKQFWRFFAGLDHCVIRFFNSGAVVQLKVVQIRSRSSGLRAPTSTVHSYSSFFKFQMI
jgi:hypothetical protein